MNPEQDRFVVFDVETPNAMNDRMSAIGITVVEAGEIQEEYYSLVNPETWFDRFNVQLTGISPAMVETQPTFGELWPVLEGVFSRGILIAHNAPFDMSVLSKCLNAYNISWRDTAAYACTCQMSRRFLPELENHRLNTLCDVMNLELNHHHAGSDSRACAEILLRYLRQGKDISGFYRQYDLYTCRTLRPTRAKNNRKAATAPEIS